MLRSETFPVELGLKPALSDKSPKSAALAFSKNPSAAFISALNAVEQFGKTRQRQHD